MLNIRTILQYLLETYNVSNILRIIKNAKKNIRDK